MVTKYEIRQQIRTIDRAWLEVVASNQSERVAQNDFDRLHRDYPDEYFELVRVESHEYCLMYTRSPKPDTPAAANPESEE